MRRKNVGESYGHFVRTISLRCFKILMQLFMLLYSGRNTVVHLCENYPVVSKRGHKFENEFFLKI